MPDNQLPVVLGTGLGGLLVSHFLCEAGVRHVLLGPDPDPEAFRLGESMAFEGAYAMWHLFSDYARYFHEKDAVEVHTLSGGKLHADLRAINASHLIRMTCALTGDVPVNAHSMHVDRYGFDDALYANTVARPEVVRVRGCVTEVQHAEDRVTALILEDGQRLSPSFVFDVSNRGRVLVKALGIPWEPVGPPERLVAALMGREGDEAPTDCSWIRSSQLLVLSGDNAELPPNGWVLPLGNRCSVGLSVAADDPRSPEALLDLLATRAEGLGRPWRRLWPSTLKQIHGPLRYGHSARAMGQNWMLVGGATQSLHFATSAGVEATLSTARLAPEALARPERVRPRYEDFLRRIRQAEDIALRTRHHPAPEQDVSFLLAWIRMNMRRTHLLRVLYGTAFQRLFARCLEPSIQLVAPIAAWRYLGAPQPRVEDRGSVT
ncbi:MAG: tryptophan 7-halogenase [Alphaproteobacteria bacterium]|nr:tryptophan 7-halogenase [Alphaproteobacteria bacterium]